MQTSPFGSTLAGKNGSSKMMGYLTSLVPALIYVTRQFLRNPCRFLTKRLKPLSYRFLSASETPCPTGVRTRAPPSAEYDRQYHAQPKHEEPQGRRSYGLCRRSSRAPRSGATVSTTRLRVRFVVSIRPFVAQQIDRSADFFQQGGMLKAALEPPGAERIPGILTSRGRPAATRRPSGSLPRERRHPWLGTAPPGRAPEAHAPPARPRASYGGS